MTERVTKKNLTKMNALGDELLMKTRKLVGGGLISLAAGLKAKTKAGNQSLQAGPKKGESIVRKMLLTWKQAKEKLTTQRKNSETERVQGGEEGTGGLQRGFENFEAEIDSDTSGLGDDLKRKFKAILQVILAGKESVIFYKNQGAHAHTHTHTHTHNQVVICCLLWPRRIGGNCRQPRPKQKQTE